LPWLASPGISAIVISRMKRGNPMSLYQAGLKQKPMTSRIGDIGRPGTQQAFSYPPKNLLDALLMQKEYLFQKNGYMATFSDLRDIPYTNIDDAFTIIKFWTDLLPKDSEKQTTALKNALKKSHRAMNRSAANYLSIPFDVAPSMEKRTKEQIALNDKQIQALVTAPDTIIRMNKVNTHEFWQGIYRVRLELDNLPPDSDSLWQATQWIGANAWHNLPEAMNNIGKWAADVVIGPIASATGKGLGSFFNGIFEGLKTPVGVAGGLLVGYLGYQYFKNKKGPTIVFNKRIAAPKVVKETKGI
jgi:hypothetical protein